MSQLYGDIGGGHGPLAKICGFLKSPTGRVISLVVGVASTILSVAYSGGLINVAEATAGGAGMLGTDQIKAFAQQKVIGWLGQNLVSSITGLPVSSMTKGEDAGNAIAAGSGVLFGKIAGGTAGGVMTKEAAITYYRTHRVMLAREAEANRARLSPFDVSTPDTFMGSIVSSLLPYFGQIQTFRGQVKTVASLAAKSIHQLLPSTKALADSDANMHAMFSQCRDYDYNHGGFENVAFDIFCNPVYGIPTETLFTRNEAVAMGLPLTQPTMLAGSGSAEPINYVGDLFTPDKVIYYLVEAGYINKEENGSYAEPLTTPSSAMKDYRDQCVTRNMVPLADPNLGEGEEDEEDLGKQFYGKESVGNGKNCILESVSDIDFLAASTDKDKEGEKLGAFVIDRDKLPKNPETEEEKEKETNKREKVDRIMFALFYTDERVQCLIDQDEDCQLDPTVADASSSSSVGEIVSNGDWPLKTSLNITSTFGCRIHPITKAAAFHSGIDIGAPEGEEVVAVRDGKVVATGFDTEGGYFINIQDNDGNTYSYSHLQEQPALSVDQEIKKGQQIAKAGNTGNSTGSHLHFQVQDSRGLYQHPLKYLGDLGTKLLKEDESGFKDQGVSETELGTVCGT